MTFLFKCPECGNQLEAHEEWNGLQVQCLYCNKEIVIVKPRTDAPVPKLQMPGNQGVNAPQSYQSPTAVPSPQAPINPGVYSPNYQTPTAIPTSQAPVNQGGCAQNYQSGASFQQPQAAPQWEYHQSCQQISTQKKSLFRYFIDSFSTKFMDSSSRACRKEYWGTLLFIFLFTLIIIMPLIFVNVLYISIFGEAPSQVLVIAATVIGHIIGLFQMIAMTSLLKRRMHDLGQSGAVIGSFPAILFITSFLQYISSNPILLALVGFFNIASLITYIVVGCLEGNVGDNAYGPDPSH